MKKKIINNILNLFKIKSIVTFTTVYIFIYLVKNNQIEPSTTTAVIMMVFGNLFNKEKNKESDKNDI